jgi:hypothetical protein
VSERAQVSGLRQITSKSVVMVKPKEVEVTCQGQE